MWGIFVIICLYNVQLSFGDGNATAYHWAYHGANDPATWAAHFADCSGSHQSPLNIDTTKVTYDANLGQLSFHGYGTTTAVTLNLDNNGHSVSMYIGGTHNMHINGGGLTEDYPFYQLHFHWGSDDTKGSEHTLNGKAYPLEMHLIHFAKQYPNVSMAQTEKNGLAVIGIVFKIGAENVKMNSILDQLKDVVYEDNVMAIPTFPVESVLPPNASSVFYRYEGSLTTPPCYESVLWTVFKDPGEISAAQMAKFRTIMKNKQGEPNAKLEDNFRATQPHNGRVVTTNDELGVSQSGASTFSPMSVFIITSLLIKYMM